MDRNRGKDRDEIIEDFADDLLSKDTNSSRDRISSHSKSHGKTILLWAVGILVFIVLLSLLFGGGTKVSKKELESVYNRLAQLEKKTETLEGLGGKIAELEKGDKELEKGAAKRDRSIGSLKSQIDKLSKQIDGLQKSMPSTSGGSTTPNIKQERRKTPANWRYHEVRPGDSLYGIAQKYGISVDELCRINNITKKHVIQPGQKLKVTQSK